MRLLLHATLVTQPFVHPLTASWVTAEVPFEARDSVTADDLGPEDVALLPSAEMAWLHPTHQIVPDAAIVARPVGAIALRTPVRPDEVEDSPVRLWGADRTAEFLARSTLRQFYGIVATAWETGEAVAAQAQAVVVQGAEALRSPEAGYQEDLCRAWYIMTGASLVGYVVAAPDGWDRERLQPALATLRGASAAAHDRRTELRCALAAAHGLDRDRLAALFLEQRRELVETDRPALLEFLRRGRDPGAPEVPELRYLPAATV